LISFAEQPLDEKDGLAMVEILKKYHRLKPQWADAALVHSARREAIDTVFTLDRRDFQVYRPNPKRTLRLLPDLARLPASRASHFFSDLMGSQMFNSFNPFLPMS
jgi:hypothetical protein